MTDYARQTAAAACKEALRLGAGTLTGAALMKRLVEEANLYDNWTIHATKEHMEKLLDAEWRKLRGRVLGGYVSARVLATA